MAVFGVPVQDIDLEEALDIAAQNLAEARFALDDEHEKNLRSALARLERVSVAMSELVHSW